MPRRTKTAEIPPWTCLARPYKRNYSVCKTFNDSGTRHCKECGCAFWISSEMGETYNPKTTALEQVRTIDQLCDAYQDARERIREVFDLAHLCSVETDYGCGFNPEDEHFEGVMQSHRIALWRKIIRESGIDQVMSQKRKSEFWKAIDRGEVPEVDAETVRCSLRAWRDQMPSFFQETIRDVFDWLTPPAPGEVRWDAGYKSHDGMTIGKRVVKDFMVEASFGGGARISYGCGTRADRKAYLQDLDNIFHLYDGKGFATHEKDSALIPAMEREMAKSHVNSVETPYFKIRWFTGKGSIHIYPDQRIAKLINEDMLADRLPPVQFCDETEMKEAA